jgi:hypothetical protein
VKLRERFENRLHVSNRAGEIDSNDNDVRQGTNNEEASRDAGRYDASKINDVVLDAMGQEVIYARFGLSRQYYHQSRVSLVHLLRFVQNQTLN